MENLAIKINPDFWRNKSVFLTGHTGFKGGWLALWLQAMGANVTGYSLEPETKDSFYHICRIGDHMTSIMGDVRDYHHLSSVMKNCQPEIIFHLAAQPLVIRSYQEPMETYSTNVMGVVHILEAARQLPTLKSLVNVTTDKCYENTESERPYHENDRLGGYDPYSNSKACSELITKAYRSSFWNDAQSLRLASARAGNVIGGGDWSQNRLVPDIIRAYTANENLVLRYPHAIRPWQHVLEPLSGYLLLAEKLCQHHSYAQAWNFGPDESDFKTVGWVADHIKTLLNASMPIHYEEGVLSHETSILKLDCNKAKDELAWQPCWDLKKALNETVQWYKMYLNLNASKIDRSDLMRQLSMNQINDFNTVQ